MENRELHQLISILLQYPEQEIIDNEFTEINHIVNEEIKFKLKTFIDYLKSQPISKLTEDYVNTFDFNEKANLYLTYSKLKDEKERGNILVKLKEIYRDEGYEIENEELPDYYPLFLEFLSIADEEIIKNLVPQFKGPINDICTELKSINSPYVDLIEASLLSFAEILEQ